MSDLNLIFAENLKRVRAERGLTQTQLGNAINYSNKAVSKWESGCGLPGVEVLVQIAGALGVDLNTLLYRQQPVYYLGIDGGGTKTALALADARGRVIRTAKYPACNPVDIGMQQSQSILKDGITEILKDTPCSFVSLFAGIAGGTTGDNREIFASFFGSMGFASAKNDNDAQNAIAVGLAGADGIAAIMGTGSIVYAVAGGERHRVGGYGYLFGDGGSGYDIGCSGIRAALAAADGSGQDTMIRKLLEVKIGKPILQGLSDFYKSGKTGIAAQATAVFTAYTHQDSVAERILHGSMKQLALQITAAARKFCGSVPVTLVGGLTKKADILLPILKQYLPKTISTVTVCPEEPYIGALMLAGAPIRREDSLC